MSILYIYISIPTLELGSSVPVFLLCSFFLDSLYLESSTHFPVLVFKMLTSPSITPTPSLENTHETCLHETLHVSLIIEPVLWQAGCSSSDSLSLQVRTILKLICGLQSICALNVVFSLPFPFSVWFCMFSN